MSPYFLASKIKNKFSNALNELMSFKKYFWGWGGEGAGSKNPKNANFENLVDFFKTQNIEIEYFFKFSKFAFFGFLEPAPPPPKNIFFK